MDPANTRAHARSARGLERELHQARTQNPHHPRFGGTRGYLIWERSRSLSSFHEHYNYGLTANVIDCHPSSVRRWENRLIPYRMTGGFKNPRLQMQINSYYQSASSFSQTLVRMKFLFLSLPMVAKFILDK